MLFRSEESREDESRGEAKEGPSALSPGQFPEAQIPTWEEFRARIPLGSGIPDEFLREYFDKCNEQSRWVTRHGRLIGFASEVQRWWTADRASWEARQKKAAVNGESHGAGTLTTWQLTATLREVVEKIALHPSNASGNHHDPDNTDDQKRELKALRAEHTRLSEALRARAGEALGGAR